MQPPIHWRTLGSFTLNWQSDSQSLFLRATAMCQNEARCSPNQPSHTELLKNGTGYLTTSEVSQTFIVFPKMWKRGLWTANFVSTDGSIIAYLFTLVNKYSSKLVVCRNATIQSAHGSIRTSFFGFRFGFSTHFVRKERKKAMYFFPKLILFFVCIS